MAGIYVHIPFCRKACHYCDFHFSTSLKTKEKVLEGIVFEALQRKKELSEDNIETIYFGGGTPSLLTSEELELILKAINQSYTVSTDAELTLEANPEDITVANVIAWKKLGFNRLSIGIQSFDDEILTWMNRSHNAGQALDSVKLAQANGITNISIDLIYGVPHRTLSDWKNEITTALELGTSHVSSYCLTIEPQTVFGKKAAKGEVLSSPNSESSEEFLTLVDLLGSHGVNLYEVSNFSRKGFESKHNSNYWNGAEYIGLGPGAHSYSKGKRSWNVSNNAAYSKAILAGKPLLESEELTFIDRFNEYVMTNLRRREGLSFDYIEENFKFNILDRFSATIQHFESSMDINILKDSVVLTTKGFLLADRIASDLFLTHD